MQRRQDNSAFLRRAMQAGWLASDPLRLLDIGASGGIAPYWNQFRPRLRALGIDPLVAEVDRLNAAEADPAIRYAHGWVGAGATPDHGTQTTLHEQTSAVRAQRGRDYIRDVFNAGAALAWSDRQLTVDGLVAEGALPDPDVVKIDVDFFESFVLDGAARSFAQGRVLLIECECGFHERIGAPWRPFSHVDATLRAAGYRLLDIEPWRYTRGALPGRFLFDLPAQTEGGQVSFCDAVWFLDPSVDAPALERLRPDPAKFAKLVLLLESYGYPDVAAAVLLRLIEAGAVPPGMDARAALDWLVPPNPFGATTHDAYLAAFDADPRRFQPGAWAAAEASRRAATLVPVPAALAGADWRLAYAGAKLTVEEAATTVETAPEPWSYAAALGLDAAALPEGDFVLEVEAEVLDGVAYATLAAPDLAAIGEQHRLAAGGEGPVLLRLPGTRANGRTHLLLRNGDAASPARLRVTALRCLA
jgi:hypothetical protein